MEFDIEEIYSKVGIMGDLYEESLDKLLSKFVPIVAHKETVRDFMDDDLCGLFLHSQDEMLAERVMQTIVKAFVDNRVQSYITSTSEIAALFKENSYSVPEKFIQPRVLAVRGYGITTPGVDISQVYEKIISIRTKLGKKTLLVSDVPQPDAYSTTVRILLRQYFKPCKAGNNGSSKDN